VPLDEMNQELEEVDGNEPEIKEKPARPKENKFLSQGPDLHSMGTFFLNRVFRVIFEISVLLHL
jgi:hypothetical protein